MALFCAIVRAKIMLFADPRAAPSMLLMNHIVGKNHITPAGSEIRGKRPHSAQKSRDSTGQWTDARNSTAQVTNTHLIGVLVAIFIPIFTSQLEKAREATDVTNIRSAYAECSAAVLTEANSGNATYNITDGSASEEVALHQKAADWTDNNKEAKIGNQEAKDNFNFAEGNTKATVKITKDGTLTIVTG
jgi:type II secretory pathway pseudopilin PulG